ncbi:putative acyl-CoA-binding protein [Daldinia childiae]|uniref:putative acyl-CoA-binding protein n=1 Tax=Daldinia childiae TaxID=326645 RepID=UPI00144815F7|nr:putative acyl-CoA-binding protein [Daldinia childiae]KAF3061953.1 putative acyl-CoA-binding protein [Daldinia childiae]
MVDISPAFAKAQEDSRKLTSKPGNDELLELYGLFKVGNGEDFSKAEKPGVFDLKNKYKYQAWQKLVDEGISPADAQDRYVKLVETLKEKYGYDANKEPEAVKSS